MLKLDKNDPLDRMILQELHGIPVTFDAFLDAMGELEEEPDCAQILRERGLRAQDVLRDAEAYRADFLARLSERKLPIDDRFSLCAGLFSQARRKPSLELRRIYCEILCDPGFLLDSIPVPEDDEDKLRYEEQVILQYLDFRQDRDDLLEILARRKGLSEKLLAATKKIRNPQPVDCAKERSYEVAAHFTEIFDLPPKGRSDILLGNLSNYMHIAEALPALKSIEPLFLFRLLTKHQSRMCTVPDLNVSLPALWKRDNQQIVRNNGRNFKQYKRNLRLFNELCQLFQTSEDVDLPLCWYGLDQITVLGDFYRERISLGWEYADQESDYPFMPTIDEVVEDACFSCFQDCYKDNAVLRSSDITLKELDKFRENEKSPAFKALEELSDYMNAHIVELATQMVHATQEEVQTLCRDILEQSTVRYRPKSPHETELFLASINGGLMEAQDWLAGYLLTQAGHALLGEPTEISEWPG